MNEKAISKKIGCFLIVLSLISCKDDKSRGQHDFTIKVCPEKNVFAETYLITGGGAHGGDRVSTYLTDSVNFRHYIGTYNNDEIHYDFSCNGDSVVITEIKREVEGVPYNTKVNNKIIKREALHLKAMQKTGVFD